MSDYRVIQNYTFQTWKQAVPSPYLLKKIGLGTNWFLLTVTFYFAYGCVLLLSVKWIKIVYKECLKRVFVSGLLKLIFVDNSTHTVNIPLLIIINDDRTWNKPVSYTHLTLPT